MEKITMGELYNRMTAHNSKTLNGQRGEPITGVIVYKPENWTTPYTEEQRSYRVSSNCWGFMSGKISNAVYGDCLDGTDIGVRLDWYNWSADYCYMD